MPRRSVLTPAQQATLFALPATEMELARYYTLDARDLTLIRQRRGTHNRLGFALQLCYLRYPGQALSADTIPSAGILAFVAHQLGVPPDTWSEYARRDETRREHALELQAAFGYLPFTVLEYRRHRGLLTDLALQTNKAIVIAQELLETLRTARIIVPPARVIDRCCAEALARGTRLFYRRLTEGLDADQRRQLDRLLLPREESRTLLLTWLRQPPGEAKARTILTHLDRLQALRSLGLPADLERAVHQSRLTQLAREGAQMSAQHLRDLEDTRRYATLVAVVLDTQATIIDQILDLNDRVIGKLFADAKRKHREAFHDQGRAINEKVRLYARVGHALITARQTGTDPFTAIEQVVPWETFTHSVAEADQLVRPAAFDHLPLIADGYSQVRRYAPRLLDGFAFNAAPAAQHVLDGINTLKALNQANARAIPQDAVTASLLLRKLASYPRQNSLALALREIGRLERTLFTLRWLLDPPWRQQVTAGLNKGEAKNTLARAVCFNRLGEIRDRTYDQQRHRASGLNLVVAAIVLWNTVYLERAVEALRHQGRIIDERLHKHVAPVHWNHINLTGDYSWRQNKRVKKGGFRPLRPAPRA